VPQPTTLPRAPVLSLLGYKFVQSDESTDFPKEYITSTFRAEEEDMQGISVKLAANFLTFNMETYFSEILTDFYRITHLFIPVQTGTDNKVREPVAVKVLHTSLLNITVVDFKILPLGSYVLVAVKFCKDSSWNTTSETYRYPYFGNWWL
jgi:hypothetical protein